MDAWKSLQNTFNRYKYTSLQKKTPRQAFRYRHGWLIKWIVIAIVLGIASFFAFCQLELNVQIYPRYHEAQNEESFTKPLSNCFNNISDDSPYRQGPANYTISLLPYPPVALNGMIDATGCFDYAATIQPRTDTRTPSYQLIYHAYWRIDLAPVGPKQLATLRSFFATQPKSATLYLWSNGDVSTSKVIKDLKSKFGDRLQTPIFDPIELSRGTPMENSVHLQSKDPRGYLDGDLLRLLVVYRHGGMWFDMDSLFVRDMSMLFEQEWLMQWDCYMPRGFPFNGAFMHFRSQSPYLCEMLSELTSGPPPRQNTYDWGGYMYYRVYRRLILHGVKPWSVLPWCFTDPSNCNARVSLPSAFENKDFSKERLLKTFAFHWHNQWKKEPGSLFRFLESRHIEAMGW